MYSLNTDFSIVFLILEYCLKEGQTSQPHFSHMEMISHQNNLQQQPEKKINHRMLCGIQENTLKAYHWRKSNEKLIQYLRQNGFVHNLYLVAYVELPSKK